DQAAGRVHQRRLKPAPVSFDDLGRYVWMNDGRLEECGLELEHTRNFYLTYTPAVSRATRRLHQSALPFSGSLSVNQNCAWSRLSGEGQNRHFSDVHVMSASPP